MFKSYNEENIRDAYKYHKGKNDKDFEWAFRCGNSTIRMVEAYDEYSTNRKTGLKMIKDQLEYDLPKMYEGGSSYKIAKMLLSGKYDSKLVMCKDRRFRNNLVVISTINNGKLPVIQVLVADCFDRTAPTDYTVRLDWLMKNFDDIFVIIED